MRQFRNFLKMIVLSFLFTSSTVVFVATARASTGDGRPVTDTGYRDCPDDWWRIETIPNQGTDWHDQYHGNWWTAVRSDPSWTVSYNPPGNFSWNVIDDMRECLAGGTYYLKYGSFSTYDAQVACHDFWDYGNLAGPTWDLEGGRRVTWNIWTWTANECNW